MKKKIPDGYGEINVILPLGFIGYIERSAKKKKKTPSEYITKLIAPLFLSDLSNRIADKKK